MIKVNKVIGFFVVLFLFNTVYDVKAAQVPSNISPQQIAQFKKLSPCTAKVSSSKYGD